jgi:hypothetical protein
MGGVMTGALTGTKLAFVVLLCLFGSNLFAMDRFAPSSDKDDVGTIYTTFLKAWHEKNHSSFNLSRSAVPAQQNGVNHQFYTVECGGIKNVRELPSYSTNDLSNIAANLSFAHVVDKWHPLDVDALVAKGESEESAVTKAYENGLMILNAITFDDTQNVAIFAYSFTCGPLWGSGGVAVFRRTATGWVQIQTDCAPWVS